MALFFFFFFLPDRPTAEKTIVKNPPFKESTDCGLNVALEEGQNIVVCYFM